MSEQILDFKMLICSGMCTLTYQAIVDVFMGCVHGYTLSVMFSDIVCNIALPLMCILMNLQNNLNLFLTIPMKTEFLI